MTNRSVLNTPPADAVRGGGRLYLLTPPDIGDPSLFARVLADTVAVGGVMAVQLRLKTPDGATPSTERLATAARPLIDCLNPFDIPLIVNDDPAAARLAGAAGVHIGQSDADYERARAAVGDDGVVGVTCHASMHLAIEAGEAGADYVAFGAFHPSETKAAPTRAPLSVLEDWSTATVVPCVAIGGVAPPNAPALVEAGADYLAVSGAVWNDADGAAAALRKFNEALAPFG